MAITVEEAQDSRDVQLGDEKDVVLRYVIKGTADDYEAVDAMLEFAPEVFRGLVALTPRVKPQFVDVNHPSKSVWRGTLTYGRWRDQPEMNESRFSFDTTGGTEHISHAREHIKSYARKTPEDPEGENATDYKGAINVQGTTVRGVDIFVSRWQFQETHYIPHVYVTSLYKMLLANVTGTVNVADFRCFKAGEVLFLGATGQRRSQEDWEITYRFAASPNRTDLEVGDITGIAKKGWEYMWVEYEEENAEGKKIIPVAVGVHIERVYRWGAFSVLGIGTT